MSTQVERAHLLEVIAADCIHWNLSPAALYEEAVRGQEAVIAAEGPLAYLTGQHTGRSPNDKFVVREPSCDGDIAWGPINRPMDAAQFELLQADLLESMAARQNVYVLDCYAGADPTYRLPIRVVNELAWHNLFARHMFIRNPSPSLAADPSAFTVIDSPSFKADPKRHG